MHPVQGLCRDPQGQWPWGWSWEGQQAQSHGGLLPRVLQQPPPSQGSPGVAALAGEQHQAEPPMQLGAVP